jgi:hypothetical protein
MPARPNHQATRAKKSAPPTRPTEDPAAMERAIQEGLRRLGLGPGSAPVSFKPPKRPLYGARAR